MRCGAMSTLQAPPTILRSVPSAALPGKAADTTYAMWSRAPLRRKPGRLDRM